MNIISILHNNHLTHPLISLGWMGMIVGVGAIFFSTMLLYFIWFGAFAGILFYYGREIRDTENNMQMNFTQTLPNLSFSESMYWSFRGWNLFNWTDDGIADFWPVVVSNILIALIATTMLTF